ncbi:MAG: DUF3950 domain-containing protein [Gilliamella sp.]|uniref:YlcI/YnfO family protein n=1 Tax=Gilliamella TaxID=1193503 RepID=UPI000A14AD9E|nr:MULTISPECIES: YlcI/YnfO family protein [Gilliamella]MCO6539801.1 DUF3950 domain-containing protein [Gilliamella sp.]
MQEENKKRSFDRSKSTSKIIRFEDDLLELMEKQILQESSNFSAWVKDACREKLAKLDKK